ncbi:MAG TPA: tRNA (adenosine(37)-N6)-threonylcarbamoyltransferase complex dimerization subunit type 1 TsaB [Alloacidobacterium sp.]|nr:tRNA (adenosine(37)-N6)-threonylcarbamoyltransferase complex dimerization subunit type 1 TsaB [Alloacidobacterium sp.]
MLLGIDTCGSSGTITLAHHDGACITRAATAELAGKTYAAMLVPRLRALLEENQKSLRDVEAIIVVNGPGSFTGVRIGISAVKGLAELFATPVLAVSRLRVLSHIAVLPYAAFDAGRGEFYVGKYGNEEWERLLSAQELQTSVPAGELAVCEEKSLAAFPEAHLFPAPAAYDAIAVALPRLRARDFDDIALLDGNYLRRSDAELFAKSKPDAAAHKLQNV